jgi:uncharacterized protein (TIGR03083 family)
MTDASAPPADTVTPEAIALMEALDQVEPDAPTACAGWTTHDILAHLTAGSKELADLIGETLDGRPDRATRGFEERELPFRTLPHDELREQLFTQSLRKRAAYDALAERVEDPTILFTGTRISVAELETHSRSEAAIHRWDLVGDDAVSDTLLAQPELTAHAVKVLNRMPVLDESARALAARVTTTLARPLRAVLRSPGQVDVVFLASGEGGCFEIADRPAEGDVVLTTDAAGRLLALWGRRSASRPLDVAGDPALVASLQQIWWPRAQAWPPA